MHYWLIVLAIIFHTILPWQGLVPNAVEVNFTNALPDVKYGVKVAFKTQVKSSVPIQKVFIYVEPQGQPAVYYPMTLAADGTASYTLDLVKSPLRVFSTVFYHYRATLDQVGDVDSEKLSFDYRDDRFNWKTLKSDTFEINWYDRDVDFGQLALNTANSGLDSAEKILPVILSQPIRIFIYATPQDLQATRPGMPTWVAGHTTPDIHMILVTIPSGPEQRLELERQLPHELTHILQYEAYGQHSSDFPVWLLEGSASAAELYPNPEYANVLQTSAAQDQLMPMELLCTAFPQDASGAFLAYAQSQSFVRFLLNQYGSTGMQSLFNQYRDGLGCKEGVQAAFSTSLSELEYQWRLKALHINPAALIVQNLIPYLVFLLLILGAASVTIIFSYNRRRAAGVL